MHQDAARACDFQEIPVGLFDGIVGGLIGAEMTHVVNGLIEKHGGVQGVVSQLQNQGLGETVRSWVGTGNNLPISAEQIQQAFGSGPLQELAAKFGMDPQVLAQKLSEVLPHAVNHLTPGGNVPS
jgi:uncharacterized protein YidB (DUF937 family)